MRIIRFLGEDGRVHHGLEHEDGSATVLLDPLGVLGHDAAVDHHAVLRGKHALIADDDENMRQLMTTVLTRAGCTCTVCANGEQAVDAIERGAIDLVVSDIIMPHHNGYEIFAAARHRRGDMPVVLVTGFGYDPTHSLIRASNEGLTTVLYKPFTPQQLLDELTESIRNTTVNPADALIRSESRMAVVRALAPLEPVGVFRIDCERGHGDDVKISITGRPNASVIFSDETLRIPTDGKLLCAGQLALIVGLSAKDVSPLHALRNVLGYSAANDLTLRGARKPVVDIDVPCPLGPAIVTAQELPDPNKLMIRVSVNGRITRRGSIADAGWSVESIVSDMSRKMTLEPGMVVLMPPPPIHPGAPRPAEPIRTGDTISVQIDGIGELVTRIEAADES